MSISAAVVIVIYHINMIQLKKKRSILITHLIHLSIDTYVMLYMYITIHSSSPLNSFSR